MDIVLACNTGFPYSKPDWWDDPIIPFKLRREFPYNKFPLNRTPMFKLPNFKRFSMRNKNDKSADAAATQKQGGIAEVMHSVFGGIASVIGTSQQDAMAASGFSTICVCVVVIAMAMMLMSPAGQNMGRSAMTKF